MENSHFKHNKSLKGLDFLLCLKITYFQFLTFSFFLFLRFFSHNALPWN